MEVLGPAGWGSQPVFGFGVTLAFAATSYLCAFLVGLFWAFIALSPKRSLSRIWQVFASIIMGVPTLLVIFFVFYNLPFFIRSVFGMRFDVPPFLAGVIALSLVYSSYIGEAIRGAIINVSPGQFDAGKALGFSTIQRWMFIILPQAFRIAARVRVLM